LHAASPAAPAQGPQFYAAPRSPAELPPVRRAETMTDPLSSEAPALPLSARLSRLALAQRQHHQGWR
jgi:hypothetical protein